MTQTTPSTMTCPGGHTFPAEQLTTRDGLAVCPVCDRIPWAAPQGPRTWSRALLTNPRLLLCDEISLGLAPVIVNTLYEIIPTLAQRGIGLLIVEQDISRSLAVADRFYCLLEGSVTLTGRPAEVPRETVTRHYFGL